MIRAYLGLGANLGDRRETLEHAISLLSQRPGIRLLRISSLYETEPVDVAGEMEGLLSWAGRSESGLWEELRDE